MNIFPSLSLAFLLASSVQADADNQNVRDVNLTKGKRKVKSSKASTGPTTGKGGDSKAPKASTGPTTGKGKGKGGDSKAPKASKVPTTGSKAPKPSSNPSAHPSAHPSTQTSSQYRIANAAYTGWRPGVTEFWMKDANGVKIEDGSLICSGQQTVAKKCQNAVDMVYPWWRPQCVTCQQTEAWIGFELDSNVEVSSAYAKGLGVGSGGGNVWNGGVVLQKSDDGGDTWNDIAVAANSDLVDTEPSA